MGEPFREDEDLHAMLHIPAGIFLEERESIRLRFQAVMCRLRAFGPTDHLHAGHANRLQAAYATYLNRAPDPFNQRSNPWRMREQLSTVDSVFNPISRRDPTVAANHCRCPGCRACLVPAKEWPLEGPRVSHDPEGGSCQTYIRARRHVCGLPAWPHQDGPNRRAGDPPRLLDGTDLPSLCVGAASA